jgi:hypothetical protein
MKTIFSLTITLIMLIAGIKLKAQAWTEDFESNWTSRWYVSNGTWDVGTPNYVNGPSTAHGGVSCAGTNLTGDYPDNIDTRLIRYVDFTVPSANLNPRLRFWHWFSFSSSDSGRVQIKTNNSIWTDLTIYTYYNTCSGVWSVEEIDLSDWADSSVQIALYLHTEDAWPPGWDVSAGWYVDDMELRTGAYTFNSPDGFENGEGDWSVERGSWEIGIPTSGPYSSHTGLKCAATNLSGNYDDNVDSRLRTTWLKLQPASYSPAISFWHWFSFSSSDNGRVQLRTHNSNWQDIPNTNVFSGVSSPWTFYYISLSDWADSTIQIAFYLHTEDAWPPGWDVSSGWYIDDISINGLVTNISELTSKNQKLKIYPNPATNNLTIETPQKATIEILNIKGQIIKSINNANIIATIDLDNFSSGVYIIKAKTDKEVMIKKFIKE